MPANAGIHKLLILNADKKLDSGLRRNDEIDQIEFPETEAAFIKKP